MPRQKYQLVTKWLQEQICIGMYLPQQRLPTEAELCVKFQLSRNAVRNALCLLAGQGWLTYIKNRGYFVAENIDQKRQAVGIASRDKPSLGQAACVPIQNIGLLCFFPGNYIFPDIINGFNSLITSSQYNIILRQSEYLTEQERVALETFLEQNVAGIVAEPIFDGNQATNHDMYAQLIQHKIPIVFLDNDIPDIGASSILCHDQLAGHEAAKIFLGSWLSRFHSFLSGKLSFQVPPYNWCKGVVDATKRCKLERSSLFRPGPA